MRPEIEEVKELVIKGSAKKVAKAVQAALDAGCDASEILNQGMVEAMSEVGEQFSKNEIFVSEMLVAARAMKKGVAVLQPDNGYYYHRKHTCIKIQIRYHRSHKQNRDCPVHCHIGLISTPVYDLFLRFITALQPLLLELQ